MLCKQSHKALTVGTGWSIALPFGVPSEHLMLVEHIAMCSHNTSVNHRTSEGRYDTSKLQAEQSSTSSRAPCRPQGAPLNTRSRIASSRRSFSACTDIADGIRCTERHIATKSPCKAQEWECCAALWQ